MRNRKCWTYCWLRLTETAAIGQGSTGGDDEGDANKAAWGCVCLLPEGGKGEETPDRTQVVLMFCFLEKGLPNQHIRPILWSVFQTFFAQTLANMLAILRHRWFFSEEKLVHDALVLVFIPFTV